MERQCDLISLHWELPLTSSFGSSVGVDKSGGFQTHFSMASQIEWPWWDQMRDIWNILGHHIRLAIRFALRHGLPSGLSLARIVHNFPMISPHGLRSLTPMFVLDQELTIWIANPNGRQHHVAVAPGDEGDLDLFRLFFICVFFPNFFFYSKSTPLGQLEVAFLLPLHLNLKQTQAATISCLYYIFFWGYQIFILKCGRILLKRVVLEWNMGTGCDIDQKLDDGIGRSA